MQTITQARIDKIHKTWREKTIEIINHSGDTEKARKELIEAIDKVPLLAYHNLIADALIAQAEYFREQSKITL